ncbi:MAG: 2Fe-2S iron-sulfur cluster-binding protein [Blastomonas sp.]|jgi:2Fe-2S ferredoxin
MVAITITITDVKGNERVIDDAQTGSSLMEAVRLAQVEGIIAECGGACSCATCHVYIDQAWAEVVGAPNDVEDDMLAMVDDIRQPTSRLSCQIELTPELAGLRATVAPEL